MTDYKVKRTPLLPPIPREEEFEKFDRLQQWRRGHLSVMEQLHRDIYDDVQSLANSVANIITKNDVMGYVSIFPWFSPAANVGAWSAIGDANQYLGTYCRNTSSNNFDLIEFSMSLKEGTYQVDFHGIKGANSGIVYVILSQIPVGNAIDLYAAATTYNFSVNMSVTVPASGNTTVGLKVQGKNASSNDYICAWTNLTLRKTA